MMKQPAENINATPEEVEATLERAVPIFHDSPVITQEVAKLAYKYWQERNGLGALPKKTGFEPRKSYTIS
jgi:hypothetical protein